MLLLDIDSYEEKYGEKAVRKNLTIPAWLNPEELQKVQQKQVFGLICSKAF